MEELDYLEKNLLKTISDCSVFGMAIVTGVYKKTKSYDKTIRVLKYAVENAVDINTAYEKVVF